MDVARLGIEVTSKGTPQATNELQKLTNASAKAEAATQGLSSATKNASAAAVSASVAANNNRASIVASGNAAKAGSMQMRMIAMQLSQVAQQTQVTGNFIQALAVQIPDMALGFGAVGIAMGVVLGVLLQIIPAAKMAASAIRSLADILPTIAPYAVGAAAALALLYAPAIIGGIVSVIALLGRLAVAAVSAGVAIAAANPLGAFVLGVTAAVAAMNIFRDEIAQIFGRDIVADVKNAANFVINSFEAAFEDIKFLWNQFPNIIGAAVIGAANAVITTLTDMVQRGANIIDTLRKKVNEYLPAALQSGMIGDLGLSDFKLQDPYSGRLNDAWTDRNANIAKIMGQDRVGQFGEAISRGASAASGKLKELADWMTTVDEKKKKKGGKTDAELYSDIVDGANRRIAALKAEQLGLGMSEQAALSYKYETELLNEAQQKGINLTVKQRAELNALAGQMATTEIATKKAREAMEFVKSTALGFVNDLRNGLKNGEGFWKSFGNAALNVLDRITDKLLGDVMDAIFKVGNAGGGGGGLLGTIFGGLFGGGSQFSIASAGGIGLYADGTASARAGLAMVGEEGPELVRFKGGEKVIPNHQLRGVNDNRGGGQGISVSAPVSINIDATGADAAGLARVERQLASLKAELPNQIVSTVQNAQKRRGL